MGYPSVSLVLGLLTLVWALVAAALTWRRARLPADTDVVDQLWATRSAVVLWIIALSTLVLTAAAFIAEHAD